MLLLCRAIRTFAKPERIAAGTAFVCAQLVLLGSGPSTLIAAEVTATRLDGSSITGELRSWSNDQVVVAAPSKEEPIRTDQLVSLRWPAGRESDPPPTAAPGLAELTDGTRLPLESLLVAGEQATLQLPAALGTDAPVRLSVKALAAVQLMPLDDALAKQWEEIRQSKPSGDLLVVFKRDGKSLDYIDGVLGDITADKVELKVDGESNRADRTKVAGIFYLRTPPASTAEPRVLLQGHSGLRVAATNIEVVEQHLGVTTLGGVKFNWPMGDLELADFSHGKVAYLSDLAPASQTWTPLVALPASATAVAEYGHLRRDQSAFGGALTLLVPESPADPSHRPSPRPFRKGLAIRSRTELVYRLPAGFGRFTALAGIEPATAGTGNVTLAIYADDRLALETEVDGTRPPLPLDVRIGGARRLKVVVDFGKNLDTGDWLNLCDAKIVK